MYIAMAGTAFGQGILSGSVTDAATGEALPGVNIVITETGQGTATDISGHYRMAVPEGVHTIRASYIGYRPEVRQVDLREGENSLDIALNVEEYLLGDVVVTAMGIRRSERSIGYAAQRVQGADLEGSRETNLVNALAGRSAGVFVNSSGGQPGAGSRIIIRGNASLQGNNQPLFVVDGIPISNASDVNIQGSMLSTGGTSNRGIDLDPANIEEMSVLKGASATALYGSRAANGAVIITTKSGRRGEAPAITFRTSTGWADAYTDGYQHEYLGGLDGYYFNGLPFGQGGYVEPDAPPFSNPQLVASWGPHRDEVSQQVLDDLDVDEIPLFDPRKDFYQSGLTMDHSLSLSGGTPESTYYFSVGNLDQEGIVPGASLGRTNLMVRFGSQLGERFHVETSINYINTRNRWLAEGNSPQSYLFGLNFAPISYDLSQPAEEDGTQRIYSPNLNNPYWIADNNGFTSDVDRFIASTSLEFDLLPWVTITERIGIDTYSDGRKGMQNIGTRGAQNGSMFDQQIRRSEINSDLTASVSRSLSPDISVDLLVGNNINVRQFRSEEVTGIGLTIPDYYHVSNAASIDANESVSERRMVSLYSQAILDYRDIVYLTLTGRNDWSSTLPKDNNSYFYPSASLGFVFTDAIGLFNNTPLSLGKLRASLSRIGNDAPPYGLTTRYVPASPGDGVEGRISIPFRGVNAYRLQTSLGNADLKPEISTEYELGLDLRFLEGRARLDIAYYDRTTTDQIFQVPTSSGTGYLNRLANAGEIRNYGWELTAAGVPLQTPDFRWEITLNFSTNTTHVVEFAPGVENIFQGGFTNPQIRIEDGKNGYGVIWGSRYARNDDGEILVPNHGYPVVAPDLGPIGNVQPDWNAGLHSGFSYRAWTVGALLDMRQGGDILNYDKFYSTYYGTASVTADRGSSYVFEGVNFTTGEPNDVEIIRDQAFYRDFYANIDENFVEDGSYLKLRELSLSYTLPETLIARTPFRGLTVTGTGRNLWIRSDFSYGDPEGSLLGTTNAQGLYHMVTPASRIYSITLNASF